MTGNEGSPTSEVAEKAAHWLDDAKLAMQRKADSSVLDPDEDRFFLQMDRALILSERRQAMFAKLLDRRNVYYLETGEDIILEQLWVLRALVDTSTNLLADDS